ncbi:MULTISPECIES: MptD family putative ECF transporter S component [Clostridium]|uniref:MptD family putative ECF transporter S component n=1 Tax=Clostridium senegalense TaxID=1465809 RepID=A0A6M0H8J9_9CLOT|nr:MULTISPECIES: MptD family putative ECF transporter S component [Clostridium]NEU06634.1 MptD family putative ECF transporter S component [Clostridium senegalense]
MSNLKTNKLQTKDLVTIGIFTAIYFVITILVMILVAIAPVIWLLYPGILAVVCGVIYMLLTAKIEKTGPVFIMSTITGIIYLVTGECTWVILATYVVTGLIAEVIRSSFGYKSFKGNLFAYCVFSLGMIGSPLPLWLFHDSFIQSIIEMGMDPSYVEKISTMVSGWSFIGMIIVTIICAIIGGFIGKSMLKKHFQKAGIV